MKMKKTKRLVGIIPTLVVGGAERMMITILNYFTTEEFEVHLIVFNNIGETKKEVDSRIIVHDLATSSVGKGIPKCLKKLHSIKADIIFSGIGHLNIALAPFIPFMKVLLPKTKWIARETNMQEKPILLVYKIRQRNILRFLIFYIDIVIKIMM